MNSFDVTLMPILNRGAANPALDWVMPRLTNLNHLAAFWAAVVIGAIWIVWKGSKRAKTALLCAALAVAMSDASGKRMGKLVLPRDRPCAVAIGGSTTVFAQVRVPDGEHCPGSTSFPSNHAASMMALGLVGWRFTRGRRRWYWFLLPLVIGYSRIYLGFHYPTDVLGGWVWGAIVAGLVMLVFGGRADTAVDGGGERTGSEDDPQEVQPSKNI